MDADIRREFGPLAATLNSELHFITSINQIKSVSWLNKPTGLQRYKYAHNTGTRCHGQKAFFPRFVP